MSFTERRTRNRIYVKKRASKTDCAHERTVKKAMWVEIKNDLLLKETGEPRGNTTQIVTQALDRTGGPGAVTLQHLLLYSHATKLPFL